MERKGGLSLLHGLRGRCPACGEGHLFRAFVKVAPSCEKCGEAFNHHRADDFPAYLVIILVGHLIVPLTLYVELAYSPPYWVHALIWLPLVLILSIGLLQPLKGMIVALQWQTSMHGFEESRRRSNKSAARSLSSSFRGASETSEPGIHLSAKRVGKWIPGSR